MGKYREESVLISGSYDVRSRWRRGILADETRRLLWQRHRREETRLGGAQNKKRKRNPVGCPGNYVRGKSRCTPPGEDQRKNAEGKRSGGRNTPQGGGERRGWKPSDSLLVHFDFLFQLLARALSSPRALFAFVVRDVLLPACPFPRSEPSAPACSSSGILERFGKTRHFDAAERERKRKREFRENFAK